MRVFKSHQIFYTAFDELTLPCKEALLLAYVRFVKEEKICQELLFAKNLMTDTKGESIYHSITHWKSLRQGGRQLN